MLVLALILSLTNRREVERTTVERDTTIVVKYDTIIDRKPKYIREIIVDTVYVGDNGEIPIIMTQKRYTTKEYDAWVSGYMPRLDSISIFNRTEYQTITNTITKEIYPKKMNIFAKVGVDMINNRISPNIGVDLKMKNGMYVGGKVGYYDKGVTYGVSLGYQIK